MNLRLGSFAVSIERYPFSLGFGIRKWVWGSQCSWRHGCAYVWRFKIVW